MRLIKLEVSDFRRYRGGPFAVQFDARGSLLVGPNECGKSTLFEAIQHVLFDKAKTSSAWVQHLVPYGLKGAMPTAALELEHGGRILRVQKRFGSKGEAELSERKGEGWTVIARGEEAEEQLLQALGAQPAGRGGSSVPEKWGALQWLFVPQELRALPEAGHDAASRIGLDQTGITGALKTVWTLAGAKYDASYTSTGQRKAASEAAKLRVELDEMQQRREELSDQVKKLDALSREYGEIQDQLPAMLKEVDEARDKRRDAEQSAVDLSGAEGQLKAVKAELAGCEQALKAASQVVSERALREGALTDAEKALGIAKETLAQGKIDQGILKGQFEKSKEQVTTGGDKVARLRRELTDAQHLILVRELQSKIVESDALLGRVVDLDRQLLAATKSYPGDPPDAKTMRALEDVDRDLRIARSSIPNAALRVKVEGNPQWKVLVDGSPLGGGDGVALQDVVVQGAGGSIRVEGDTSQARAHAEKAEELEQKLAEGLSKFGVAALAELKELRDERASLKASIESLQAQRKAASSKTTAELQSRHAKLQADASEEERLRAKDGVVVEHDALSELDLKKHASDLAAEVKQLGDAFEEGRTRRNALEEDMKQADLAVTRADGEHQIAQTNAKAASKELDRHRDAHGSTEKCSLDESTAQQAAERKRVEAQELERSIERQKSEIETQKKTAVRKHERLHDALAQRKARAQEIQDQLERESAAGVYSTAADLERRIEIGKERLDRLDVRDEALKLVYDQLAAVRQKAVSRVVAPVKNELDHLLAQATRGRYRLAQLDDALLPKELDGDQPCKFEDGSQGLRELVAALVRLCVARHLAASGPQALLLDDPCVHVSRERTSVLVDIINQLTASGSVQAIILTHRGEEFMGLDGNVIDVKEIRPTEPRA
jgi:DNA repair exonuclease SbcCD ATPase subunit